MIRRLTLMAALALGACQQVDSRMDAAEDIRAFIVAAQTGDHAAFERHLDRPALRASIKPQLMEAAGAASPLVRQALEAPGGEAMLDQMISPEAFQIAAQSLGPAAKRQPTAVEIAAALRMDSDDRACVRDPKAPAGCVLSFARRGEDWKLVAVKASDVRIGRG